MSSLRVEVQRSDPRPRDAPIGLSGILEILVETLSPLHISSPGTPLKVDEEQLRFILEKYGGINERSIRAVHFEEEHIPFTATIKGPTIPGSSVKGNIRARLELSFRARNGRARSCFIKAGRLMRPPTPGRHGWRHYRIWGDVILEGREPCNFLKTGEVCLLCDLFGTPGLRSLIDFSDFQGEDVELKPMRLDYGMRVLAAPEGSRFRGRVVFHNLKPEELGLLLLGMGLIADRRGEPRLLGRFKYRLRMGRVRYILEALRLSKLSQPLRLNGVELGPGERIEGEHINPIVKPLTSRALEAYREELLIVNEVKIVESLR